MAEFKTIHTNYGLMAMMQAEATGTPINPTHMAVGDVMAFIISAL